MKNRVYNRTSIQLSFVDAIKVLFRSPIILITEMDIAEDGTTTDTVQTIRVGAEPKLRAPESMMLVTPYH